MRILFTTYAARPHLYPMVPTAWAALASGHQVRMVSTPGLADAMLGTGLPSAVAGADIDADAWYSRGIFVPRRRPADRSEEEAWVRVTDQLALKQFAVADAMADGLIEYARAWRPDLIVHDPVSFAGPVAGQVLGIPTVTHLYGMARHLRLEITDRIGDEPHEGYLRLFADRGVEPRLDPSAWIDPCPPSLRWPGGRDLVRHQIRYLPYNGPGLDPDQLPPPAGRPRICVTWGTSQQKKMGTGVIELFGSVVRALAELDVEIVLTVGATERDHLRFLGDLPPNVRPVGWIPLNILLRHCSAIVHTGGTGVMLTAAACGVPQLGITKIPEGVFNVTRLAAVGAGRQLDQDLVAPRALRAEVSALLSDSRYRDAAEALRDDIEAQPAPVSAVAALPSYAAALVGGR